MAIPFNEIQKLEPDAIIELFVLDATIHGLGIYYFHAGTNALTQNVIWQGQTYVRFPIDAVGFQLSGNGPAPRPKLAVSNFMSGITVLLISYDDLIYSKVTRKRTLKKYLDAANFSGGVNPDADSTVYFPDDVYFVDRKVNESRVAVEFELVSAMDLSGLQIPKRQIIQNLCPWKYRGAECGYTGTSYFKNDDIATLDSTLDSCGKRLTSCKARFGATSELPYGGFPGADLFGGSR
ncbi:MAG: phage minor tail protein L [Pseudobdellovibrionaceae bacterium]